MPSAAAALRAPPPPSRVPQWDVLHTLSHLCQRALFLAARAALSGGNEERAGAQLAQARATARSARALAAKATVRLDPSFKRSFCKRCSTPLLPGLSSSTRVLSSASHERLVRTDCHACGLVRRLPAPTQLGAASAALARPRRLDDAAAVEKDTQAAALQPDEPATDVQMSDARSDGAAAVLVPSVATAAEQSSAPGEPAKLSQRARRRAARMRSHSERQAQATPSSAPLQEQASSSQAQQEQGSAKKQAARSRRGHKVHAPREAAAAAQQVGKRSSAKRRRPKGAPAPRLPPFHERVRGSGWDALLDAQTQQPDAASSQPGAHAHVAAALRALRGGHEIAVGIGPAGVLGPAAAPAQ